METLPLVHSYPIDATWIPDPDAKVEELATLGVDVDDVDIDSPQGHDAFLIETGILGPRIADFLRSIDD